MNFQRALIAAALMLPTAAFSQVELGTDTLRYARQIADGTSISWQGGQSVVTALGFGISDGDERFVRFDLGNATFTELPEATGQNFRCRDGGMNNPACEFALGSVSNTSVVLGLSANGDNLPPAQTLQFRLHRISRNPGNTGVQDDPDLVVGTVSESTPVTLRYRLYEDPIEANNGSALTLVDSGVVAIIDFVDALDIRAGAAPTCIADVAQNSLVFVDNNGASTSDTCACAPVQVDREPDRVNWIDGDRADVDDILGAGSAFRVDGPLAFADGGSPNPGVYIDADGGTADCSVVTYAGTLDATETFATIPTNADEFGNADAPTDDKICLSGNQVDPFTVTEFTGMFIPVAASVDVQVSDRDLGTVCEFKKNGSEDALVFNLTQDGFYTQFVRLTNPTTTAGRVFLTCFDDAADQVSDPIALSAFRDRDDEMLPESLGPNESTDLININEVWSVCGITPMGGPGSPNGRFLRLKAEGEFGTTEATTGQGLAEGIRIEGIVVSADGNSFENVSR